MAAQNPGMTPNPLPGICSSLHRGSPSHADVPRIKACPQSIASLRYDPTKLPTVSPISLEGFGKPPRSSIRPHLALKAAMGACLTQV